MSAQQQTPGQGSPLVGPDLASATTAETRPPARPGTAGVRPGRRKRAGTIPGVTERLPAGLRRSWPQRLVILFSLLLSIGMLAAAARLARRAHELVALRLAVTYPVALRTVPPLKGLETNSTSTVFTTVKLEGRRKKKNTHPIMITNASRPIPQLPWELGRPPVRSIFKS